MLAKNRQLCASGIGQTSRVDALRQAIEKARSFDFDLQGAVMASDAFSPLPLRGNSSWGWGDCCNSTGWIGS